MLSKTHLIAEDVLDGRGTDGLVVVESKDDGWAARGLHLAMRTPLANDPVGQRLGLEDTEELLRLQRRELGHVDDTTRWLGQATSSAYTLEELLG